jgi:hypothetical protein
MTFRKSMILGGVLVAALMSLSAPMRDRGPSGLTTPIVHAQTPDGYPWPDFTPQGEPNPPTNCAPDDQNIRVTVYYTTIYTSPAVDTYVEIVCNATDAKEYVQDVDAHGFDPELNVVYHVAHGAILRIDQLTLPPSGHKD